MQALQKNSELGNEKNRTKEHMDKTENKYQQGRFEPKYIRITLSVSGLTL